MMRLRKPLAVFLLSLIIGCSADNTYKITRPEMGTIVSMAFPARESPSSNIIDKAFSEIEKIDSLMSDYIEDSEVSRLNRLKPRERLKVSGDTYSVLSRSLEFSRKTDGAFDVTAAPLVKLWGFRKGPPRAIPSSARMNAARAGVGYRGVDLNASDRSVSFARGGMELDLGGVAKGYAVDKAIAILAEEGVRNAIVDAGGDMYCLGRRSRGQRWKVGIRHPLEKERLFATLELEDEAIATSGSYENFVTIGGKRYSHIIDPRTGRPVDNGVLSVSIVSDNTAAADAIATAVFVMGKDDGMDFIDDNDDFEGIIIYKDGKEVGFEISGGLKERLEIL